MICPYLITCYVEKPTQNQYIADSVALRFFKSSYAKTKNIILIMQDKFSLLLKIFERNAPGQLLSRQV